MSKFSKILIGIGILILIAVVVSILRNIEQIEPETIKWDELEQHVNKTVTLPESDIMSDLGCAFGGFCLNCEDMNKISGKIFDVRNRGDQIDVCFSKKVECSRGFVFGIVKKTMWKPIIPEAEFSEVYYLDNAKVIRCTEKEEQITESQAIAVANATEEVKEFLKLYPDAKVSVNIWPLPCVPHPCGWEADVVYSTVELSDIDISYAESNRENPLIIIKIDAQEGRIMDKYPKFEYIKNSRYCESNDDCTIHVHGCTCSNFIWKNYVEPGIVAEVCNPEGLTCKCAYNTCNTEK